MNEIGKRYIGLDVHKHYLVELGVYQELEVVMPARRVELANLEVWMKKTLTPQAPGRLPDRANRDLEGLFESLLAQFLLCIHGLGDSGLVFLEAFYETGLRNFNIIVPDLLGYGKNTSEADDENEYKFGTQIVRLYMLLDHLGVERFY